MKYHTTLSTILISLGVLLFFLAVAVFCVEYFNLDSPGVLVLNTIEKKLQNEDLPFTLSFSAIDRKMDREITVHDIDFNYKGLESVKAKTVTIVQNPASLLSKLLLKRGNIRILIEGLEFKYTSFKGNDDDSKPSTFNETELINRIAEVIEKETDGFLFSFDYEIIIDHANISYEDLIVIDDGYAEIKFDRKLILRNIYFDIPSVVMIQDDMVSRVDRLVATADRTNQYVIDASFDNLSVSSENLSLDAIDMTFNTKFATLANLELKNLHYDATLESINYSDPKTKFNFTDLTAREAEEGAYFIASNFNLTHGEYTATSENIEANVSGNLSGHYKVSVNSDIPVTIKNGEDNVFIFKGYDATLNYDGIYTLDAILDDIDIAYAEDYTKAIIDNINLNGSRIYCQYDDNRLYAEVNSNLTIESKKKYFDKATTKFSAGFMREGEEITEYFINVDGLYLPTVSSPIVGNISYTDKKLSGNFNYSDSVNVSLDRTKGFKLNAEINSLELVEFEPLIEMVTPIFGNYIAPETTLSGTFRVSSDEDIRKYSTIYSSFALSDIRFNDFRFGIAGLLDSTIEDNVLKVKTISSSNDFFRASYSGNIDLDTKLPEGHLEIINPNSGKEYMSVDINKNENNGYSFNAALPTIYDSSVTGVVERDENNCLVADGLLVSGIDSYPISVFNDSTNRITRVATTGLSFSLEIVDSIISSELEFSSFKAPVKSEEIVPLIINGKLITTFDFQDQSLSGRSTTFDLIDFRFLPSVPDIHFNIEFTNEYVALNNISVVNDFPLLLGRIYFDIMNKSVAAHIGNNDENAYLSIMKIERGYTGIIDIENFMLERFGFDDLIANASLTGRGSRLDDFTFSGSMFASGKDSSSYILRSDITLTPYMLSFTDLNYDTDKLKIHSDSISIDSVTGNSSALFDITYNVQNRDRDYPIDIKFNYSLNFPNYENFLDMGFNLIDYIKGGGFLDTQIHIDNIILDNGIGIWDRDITLSFNKDEFTASGNLLEGYYEIETKNMDVTIHKNEIISGRFMGSVVYPEYDILVENFSFNLHSIVTFMKYPIFYFGTDSYVNANLRVYGKGRNSHIFGDIFSDKVMFNTWWIDQDDFIATNLKMTIIDNELDSSLMPATMINRETGEIKEGKVRFFGTIGGPNIVDHIALDAYTEEDAKIHIICPIQTYNAQIEGYGWGHFTYDSEIWLQHMSGEFFIEDFDISIGYDPLPYWWESGIQYTDDFYITFSKNVRFILPKSDEPIMTAYIKEGDEIRFLYDTRYKNASVSGNINLKGGEIYYFNKSFYITDGSFNFPSNSFNEPRLSLRAKLTDFDSNGNKVDIFLVLNNSTLDNINPHFESYPQKSTSEIMAILGNVIISETGEESGTGLGTLANLFSSGIDIMGRAGVINNNFSTRSLTDSIRENLNLDMFSLRSQLLQNVLLDSVFTPGATVYSPISRILNNTTIFFGKQITGQIFLKGLIKLNSKEKRKNKNPFLARDLMLDFEMSLEWENPIGTFTFSTNPVNLFPQNLMDNFGISYSNRIVF